MGLWAGTAEHFSQAKARAVYELDVEIWPTCIVAPHGYRLALSIRGVYPGDLSGIGDRIGQPATGVGPFRHEDKADRAPELYGGIKTLHSGPKGSTLFADASRASIEHVQINFPARIRGWRASCNGPV